MSFIRKIIITGLFISFMIMKVFPVISQSTSVTVTPSTYTVNVNDTASVTFYINNVTNLHSASVIVKWNNSIVSFVSAIQGSFFPGGTFFGQQPVSNLVYDSVVIDQAILGPGYVSGSGLLFTIKLKALANGTSPVTIRSIDLRDPNNNEINATFSSGTIIVGASTKANLKIFLQGPFNAGTGTMNTTLNSSGYLPTTQPFNISPWNYNGSENVTSSFYTNNPNVVDWILIELRSGTTTLVARRAGFIMSNGTITDYRTGNTPIAFDGVSSGSYYVVIYYPSHLSVMSASALTLNTSSSLFDFTTGLDK